MRRLGTALICAFVAWGSGAARAGETYPTGVRTITATTATSTCIGDITTPVCAVETLLACFARRELSLCRRVTDRPFTSADVPPEVVSYRVLWGLTLREKGSRSSPIHAEVAVERFRGQWTDTYVHFLRAVGPDWRIDDWAIEGEVGLPVHIDPRKTETLERYGPVPLISGPDP